MKITKPADLNVLPIHWKPTVLTMAGCVEFLNYISGMLIRLETPNYLYLHATGHKKKPKVAYKKQTWQQRQLKALIPGLG